MRTERSGIDSVWIESTLHYLSYGLKGRKFDWSGVAQGRTVAGSCTEASAVEIAHRHTVSGQVSKK